MIKNRINNLRKSFSSLNIDGYIIPKCDEFFSEYSRPDRLKVISNFSGSAGFAVILKKKNYLFVDGRYTIQAHLESGKYFRIQKYQEIINCKLFKNLTLGIDPKVFTSIQIKKFFLKNNKIKEVEQNLIDKILKNLNPQKKLFFSISKEVVGESHFKKINKISNFLKKEKSSYLFVSAPENVAWLLNIRGFDNPNSPIPNCRLLINDKKKIYLIVDIKKVSKLIREKKINKRQVIESKDLEPFIARQKKGRIIVDTNTCSIHFENLFKKYFLLVKKEDPIYYLKSIKTKREIKNMIDCHILDGAALTKFLYWMKEVNKKEITEFEAQNKLEAFRRLNNKYMFPSFNTIAGTGENGAIVHYRATKKKSKKIKKKDIFLCDSGGQYKYGTTDVTRTICFSRPAKYIKNIFTKVLKGHIAVATTNLKKNYNGRLIDVKARKYLRNVGLDYEHGTGHGVGFYSNVHEGPQAISKYNNVRMQKGMIISNEPGFYKKGSFGIRIENLVYIKKIKKNLFFENLTLAPIDKDLINKEQLNKEEKNYLFKYHLNVYSKLSQFLSHREKKWLASFI